MQLSAAIEEAAGAADGGAGATGSGAGAGFSGAGDAGSTLGVGAGIPGDDESMMVEVTVGVFVTVVVELDNAPTTGTGFSPAFATALFCSPASPRAALRTSFDPALAPDFVSVEGAAAGEGATPGAGERTDATDVGATGGGTGALPADPLPPRAGQTFLSRTWTLRPVGLLPAQDPPLTFTNACAVQMSQGYPVACRR